MAHALSELDNETQDDVAELILDRNCSNRIEVSEGVSVRCGSRLKETCPSCSRLYANDWSAILRSGVFGEPAQDFQWIFLTLTAPSFGRTHKVPKDTGRSHCSCGTIHTSVDSALIGVPVNLDTYRYSEAVKWNHFMGRLWDATRSKLRLHFPGFEYAIVREWGARGSCHTHAILRIPIAEASQARSIASLAQSTTTAAPDGYLMRWGTQVDAQEITPGTDAAHQILYLSKALGYSLKSIGTTHRGASHAHLVQLARAAFRMRCVKCPGIGPMACLSRCHRNFGARGSVVSVSRRTKNRPGWSFTGLRRGIQKERRLEWMRINAAEWNNKAESVRQTVTWAKRHVDSAIQVVRSPHSFPSSAKEGSRSSFPARQSPSPPAWADTA